MSSTARPAQGSLSDHPFPRLLATLHREAFSGILQISDAPADAPPETEPTVTREVHLTAGHIAWAISTDREEGLRAFLVRNGTVTAQQWEEAEDRARRGTLREALTEMGVITAREMTRIETGRVEEIVRACFRLPEGSWRLRERQLPPGTPDLGIDPRPLVLEGVMRVADRRVLEQEVGPLDSVFTLTGGAIGDGGIDPDRLSGEIRAILRQIDGRRTVGEICSITSMPDPFVRSVIAALGVLGSVERRAASRVRAAAPTGANAPIDPAPRRAVAPSGPAPDAGSGDPGEARGDHGSPGAIGAHATDETDDTDEITEADELVPAPRHAADAPAGDEDQEMDAADVLPGDDPEEEDASDEPAADVEEPSEAFPPVAARADRPAPSLLDRIAEADERHVPSAYDTGATETSRSWFLLGGAAAIGLAAVFLILFSHDRGDAVVLGSPPAAAVEGTTGEGGPDEADSDARPVRSVTSGAPARSPAAVPPARMEPEAPERGQAPDGSRAAETRSVPPAPLAREALAPILESTPNPAPRDPAARARAMLTAGDLPAAARGYRASLAGGRADWSIQVLLACEASTIDRIVSEVPTSDLILLDTVHEGRPCYRLYWGRYASRDAAQEAIARDLPPRFRSAPGRAWVTRLPI